jgi:hypothetical protein
MEMEIVRVMLDIFKIDTDEENSHPSDNPFHRSIRSNISEFLIFRPRQL